MGFHTEQHLVIAIRFLTLWVGMLPRSMREVEVYPCEAVPYLPRIKETTTPGVVTLDEKDVAGSALSVSVRLPADHLTLRTAYPSMLP